MSLTLGTTDATLLTTTTNAVLAATGAQQLLFIKVSVANTDSASHKVTAYRVPLGGSPSTGNQMIPPTSILPGMTVLQISGQALVNQAALYLKCDTTNVMNVSMTWSVQ